MIAPSSQVEFSNIDTAITELHQQLATYEAVHGSSFVIIAGPSGSGKSLLASQLLIPQEATVLSLDRYYLEPQLQQERYGHINFSVPEALDIKRLHTDLQLITSAKIGSAVQVPIYSMIDSSRIGEEKINVHKRIIVEGVYALATVTQPTNFKIYIDAPEDVLLARKLKRDVYERGVSEAVVKERFEKNVVPAIQRYVLPQKQYANIIISNAFMNI